MSRAVPLLCLLAATALAEESGIRLKARLDWVENEAVTRMGRWHPVHVELANLTGRDIEGKVWAEVEVGNGKVLDLRYQRTIALPREARKRFILEVRLEGSESSVFVHADIGGFQKVHAIPILWAKDDVDPVLVVGKWPKAYLKRMERRNPGPDLQDYFPQRFVTLASPEDFPDTWRGLDGLETILWDGVEMTDLSAAQAQAIEDWVEMGGSLVVSGGNSMESCYHSPLGRILPGRFAERVEIDIEAELARKVGRVVPMETRKVLGARVGETGTASWVSQDRVPLLLERRVGLGRVCVVPFDLGCEQAMGAKGVDLLLDYLVGHRSFSVVRAASRQSPGSDVLGSYNHWMPGRRLGIWESGGSVQGYEGLGLDRRRLQPSLPLDDELPYRFNFASGVRVPPARHIAVYLGLYILACLLNLVLWRAAHRREFAWATLLTLSLGFAGYAWRDAVLNAQAAPSAQHITVIELGYDGRGGRQTSWFGFFSNIAQEVEVASTDPREALSPLDWIRVQAIGDTGVELTEDGRAPRMPALTFLPRSVKCLKTERAAPPEAVVSVRTTVDNLGTLITVKPPEWGRPCVPYIVTERGAVPLSERRPSGEFCCDMAEVLHPVASRTATSGTAAPSAIGSVDPMLLAGLECALHQRPRNGDASWLLIPILDAPARIRWDGRDVEVDQGLTLLVMPMQWDDGLDASPSLTPFCRTTACEAKDDSIVFEMTPLWDGPPQVRSSSGGEPLHWRSGEFHSDTTVLGGANPFSGAFRLRKPFFYRSGDRCGGNLRGAQALPTIPDLYPH